MAKANRQNKFVKTVKKLNPLRLVVSLFRTIRRALVGFYNYLKHSIDELKAVSWLSARDTVKYSVYVIAFIVLSAVSIGLVDLGLFKFIAFITTQN